MKGVKYLGDFYKNKENQFTSRLTLGEFIKSGYIDAAGFTLSDFAYMLGVSQATLSRLVNNKSELTPEMAVRLEVVTGRSSESWMKYWVDQKIAETKEKMKLDKVDHRQQVFLNQYRDQCQVR